MITNEMTQKTVGSITHNGTSYDIDWMFREENGVVVECEGAAFVFVGDEQIIDFCNPDSERHGWRSTGELMVDAARFICTGIMDEILSKDPAGTVIGLAQ